MGTSKTVEVPAVERKVQVKADDATLRGSYASVVNAAVSDHECTIDFINLDHSSLTETDVQGFLVARVIIANTNLRSVADLLQRQAELVEKLQAEAAGRQAD